NILTDLNVTNGISVHNGATLAITAADNVILGGGITGTSIANDGTLSIIAADAITLARDVTAGAGSVSNITASTLSGQSIYNSGTFTATAANGITLAGATGLYNSGTLTLNTKSLDITTGGIISTGNTIISAGQYAITNSYIPGLNANIAGDVSGPVRFVSLASMDIGGNYYFGNGSAIHALINPNGDQYASVDTNPNSSTFGVITNGTATGPIISVAGNFFTNLTSTSNDQVGITLFNIVNPGTAIWLIHTDAGVVENGGFKMRDLNVQFCNSDGTKCFDYMSSLRDPITGLPLDQSSLAAYISVRDIDGNGVNNDVYIVFDPEFGGPIKVFRIQPIVAKDPEHKRNDYVSAGALDDLIDGGLYRNGFMFNSPIEAIPVAFAGSSFDTISKEIYNRMEQYSSNRDPNPLTNLSRLFVPWEIDLMAAQMTMSEHTNGRVFANRMMDEFLWNRNRQLNKIWGDVSFGKFDQKILNPHSISGDSLEITGGFDFQHTHENIYGAMLRIRRASASLQDYMDLSYGSVSMPNGQVDVEVSDLTIGVGGYWVHRIENEMRFYGNLMLNFDMFDIDRTQNFTTKISGTGSAFSVTTEWGLLHNLWLQYLVGNVYARVGYSFGLDAKTRMGGADYMKYESDGYFILTPGYSLTLQKKMYLSPWTYIKPYLGGNVEYDIGGFDSVNYKFAPALRMTSYKVDMSPLWLTGRAGIDLAGISGWSLGFEYEYKYNDIIKMSNFRIGGAYRF
ncbi:MAG: hypothetical protein FWG18_02440, partial [Alphaproteobacteria bacterium]|nr:hypothetical protein [Alphaproteobacteria bacterium]